MQTYIALLRGINVGGHHKVPMKDLKSEMEKWGYSNITTLLNSGNVVFESSETNPEILESQLEEQLENKFGFSIPTRIRTSDDFKNYKLLEPFGGIEVTPEIRLYVTFLNRDPEETISLPWTSEDGSFQIVFAEKKVVFSVLDLSRSSTPKGMEKLEKYYGKDITTRNWNTVLKISGIANATH